MEGGFNLDGQEIGLNPHGERDQMTGPVVYWATDDLAAKVAEVEAAGGTVVRPLTEVGGGTSRALLTDPEVTRILEQVLEEPEPRSVLELQGLGREAWAGVDAVEHVERERQAWD